MLITYIEQKSYCVRRMQKPEKDGLWGPFQHSSSDGASLLYVHGYHMYSRIPDSISNFSNWHLHNCLLYSFTYWLSIHITLFFLKKNMYLVGGAGESFTMHNWGQWTTWRIQFSLFTTMQIPGLELRPSGLAARALNQWAISLTLHPSIDTS